MEFLVKIVQVVRFCLELINITFDLSEFMKMWLSWDVSRSYIRVPRRNQLLYELCRLLLIPDETI